MATSNTNHMVPLKPKLIPKSEGGHRKYLIDSTPEIQTCYNKVRADIERNVTQNLLQPPPTPHSARSPSDEPYVSRSPNLTPSPVTGFDDPNHGSNPQGTTEPRRKRGRRKGPLNMQTRINTAFKRKTKLICKEHRLKKTACECFDFSRLEEYYPGPQVQEPSDRSIAPSPSTSQTWVPMTSPFERTSYVDLLGTGDLMGTGGAVSMPSHQNDEINELESPLGITTTMRSNVHSIMSFDLHSAASVAALAQTSIGQPYHPGADTNTRVDQTPEQLGLIPVGSEMLGYRTRWQCEFKPLMDNTLETSSETCSWTGPFSRLSSHFRQCHQTFDSERYWSKCTRCATLKEGLLSETCTGSNCSGALWQRWVYGSNVEESIPESVPTFTQSGASESGFSSNLDPFWNYPNSSGTEPSNYWYPSYSTTSSYYDHSINGDNASEAYDDSFCGTHDSRPQLLCPLRIQTNRRERKRRASHLVTQLTCNRAPPSKSSPSRIRVRLSRYSKLSWQQLVPIIFPLIATIIRDGYWRSGDGATAPSFSGDSCALRCWSLIMLVIGFLTTWILKDSTSRRMNKDDIRCREPRSREVFENVSIPPYTKQYSSWSANSN
ncbi:hypothetical protein F4810DRAFT_712161 [Camillea tinctor]|nr:hypothetical protein F4810DRAFT_712161 [Camillea tinctor]